MIGAKIKAARNAKGYSREYMALLLNVTQSSYSRIESNLLSPDIFKLNVISAVLGMDMASLLDDLHGTHEKKASESH